MSDPMTILFQLCRLVKDRTRRYVLGHHDLEPVVTPYESLFYGPLAAAEGFPTPYESLFCDPFPSAECQRWLDPNYSRLWLEPDAFLRAFETDPFAFDRVDWFGMGLSHLTPLCDLPEPVGERFEPEGLCALDLTDVFLFADWFGTGLGYRASDTVIPDLPEPLYEIPPQYRIGDLPGETSALDASDPFVVVVPELPEESLTAIEVGIGDGNPDGEAPEK